MKTCHYEGPDNWTPCELDGCTCKECGYYWDDDDFEIEEATSYEIKH